MTETQTGDAAAAGEQSAATGHGRLQETAGQIREKVGHAYEAAVTKAGDAYGGAREKAAAARQRAATGIEDNPFAAVMGGLALGLIAGAMLPRTEREAQLLGSVGKGVTDAARTAAEAARDAGKEAFDEIGLNRDAVRNQVSNLFDAALKAAGTAGGAAIQSLKQGQRG